MAVDTSLPSTKVAVKSLDSCPRCLKRGGEREYGTGLIRMGERFWIGGNPYDGGKNLRRHGVWLMAVDHLLEPRPIDSVQFRVGAKGKEEHIHVGENHRSPSSKSSTASPVSGNN